MIAVTSRIRVIGGNADALAEQYRQRLRAVEAVPGCLGVEILRHQDRRDEFMIYTRWIDEQSYEAYRRHPAFRQAHSRIRHIPGGIEIDPDERAVDRYEVLS